MVAAVSVFFVLNAFSAEPVPVHGVTLCQDQYFPAITDDWILFCSPSSQKNRLYNRHSKEISPLPYSENWAQGTLLFLIGKEGGVWDSAAQQMQGRRVILASNKQEQVVGNSTKDKVVVAVQDRVILLDTQTGLQYQTSASPIGWHPPVILAQQVAWIEWFGDSAHIVLWNWQTDRHSIITAEQPLFLVAEKDKLAWSEPEQIVIWDQKTETKQTVKTRASGGLSLQNGRLCWAADENNQLDIWCSDGFHLDRKGAQEWPVQTADGLYFREEGKLWWMRY